MERCKTCWHWTEPEKRDYTSEKYTRPCDPDTYEPMNMPFEVKECKHPRLLFCERPVENPGFAVADGSTYFAAFFTSEDFGCVMHEKAAKVESSRIDPQDVGATSEIGKSIT